jgi:DNA-binding protein HU-beta
MMVAYVKKSMTEVAKQKLKDARLAGRTGASYTKADLINGIVKQTALSKADTELTMKAFYNYVAAKLVRGEIVTLYGFGTFRVGLRRARNYRNPHTGATVSRQARKMVSFKPSIKLNRFVS